MNISSLSSSAYYPATSSTANGKSKQSNPLENLLNKVESDLQSGNTSGASSLISSMLSHAPQGSGNSSSSGSNDSNPISTINNYLQSLQGALSSGSTSDAQSILSNLTKYLSQNPPPGMDGSGAQGAGTTAGQNPLSKALSDISNDLQSGDTSDAGSAVSTLLSNAPGSSSATSSAGSTSGGNTITQFLTSLQSALSANDTTGATSILTKFQSYLSQYSPWQNNNSGTYSSDGTLNSSSSGNSLSALV